jgi:outer membrane protein assembly factor BamB
LPEPRDATTGAPQRSFPLSDVPGSAALSAIPAGVWVSYRTGSLGGSYLYAAADLSVIGPPGPTHSYNASDLFGGGMGTTLTISGGTLWVADLGHFTCADPATGRVRATERTPQPSIVITVGHRLLGSTNAGLGLIGPPAACWAT